MNNIYIQIAKEIKKEKEMRQLVLELQGIKGMELRKKQDELYKRTEFKRNFLKARSELNGLDE